MKRYLKKLNSCSAAEDGSLYIVGGLGAIFASIFGFYYILSLVAVVIH